MGLGILGHFGRVLIGRERKVGLALLKGAGYLIRVVGLKCVAVLGESCDSVRGSDKIWAKFGFKWGTHFRCWSPVFTLSASAS